MSAHRAQVWLPHGEALASGGDAMKDLFFRGATAGHCSFQMAKPAALEAESAGKKNTHLPPGRAGSFKSHPGYCCCLLVIEKKMLSLDAHSRKSGVSGWDSYGL